MCRGLDGWLENLPSARRGLLKGDKRGKVIVAVAEELADGFRSALHASSQLFEEQQTSLWNLRSFTDSASTGSKPGSHYTVVMSHLVLKRQSLIGHRITRMGLTHKRPDRLPDRFPVPHISHSFHRDRISQLACRPQSCSQPTLPGSSLGCTIHRLSSPHPCFVFSRTMSRHWTRCARFVHPVEAFLNAHTEQEHCDVYESSS